MKTNNIKFFNTSGICSQDKHYMLDALTRIPEVERLIGNHQYFAIHAPYKAGKTTCLHALSQRLNSEGNYISLVIPFKHPLYSDITLDNMNQIIVNHIYCSSIEQLPEKHWPKNPEVNKDIEFSNYLADWSRNNEKPIVLLLDDIDTLPGDVLFLMLRHFRTGYQYRPHHFPSSIVLVGLEDVKDYKINFPDKSNPLWNPPPYNINAESIYLKDFNKEEVFELLEQHTRETGQEFPIEVKEEIFRLSQGQPWLTNALACQIVIKYFKM